MAASSANPQTYSHPVQSVLEELSIDVWERLRDVKRLTKPLGVRHGEETITDLLMLDLMRKLSGHVMATQTPKHKEAKSGTDFELWVERPNRQWVRFAVQAKRINFERSTYSGLNYKVNGTKQMHLLERFANTNGAIPVYCFYNYCENPKCSDHWRCCSKPYVEEQLGCTIATLRTVKRAAKQHGAKNFGWIHKQPGTIPLSCLLICEKLETEFTKPDVGAELEPTNRSDGIPPTRLAHHKNPPSIPSTDLQTSQSDEDDYVPLYQNLTPDLYNPEVGFPRWICSLPRTPTDHQPPQK